MHELLQARRAAYSDAAYYPEDGGLCAILAVIDLAIALCLYGRA